jgi:hypothetical protein
MKKPKVILHIGTHKSGTTFFQDVLQANQDDLRQNGIFYLSRKELRHRRVLKDIRKTYRSASAFWTYYLKYFSRLNVLKRQMNSHDVILLSDENMLGLSRDLLRPALYPGMRKNLRAVRNFFAGYDVEIWISIRDYSELIPSAYAQVLRGARQLEPVRYYCERFEDEATRPSWLNLIRDVHDMFPNSRCKVWTLAAISQDFPQLMRSLFKLDLPVLEAPTSNRTIRPSTEVITKSLEIANSDLDRTEKRRLVEQIFENDPRKDKFDFSDQKVLARMRDCFDRDIQSITDLDYVTFLG